MAKDSLLESPLWEQFQKAARERRRNPVRLLTDYMRECLEIWEDQKLHEEIRADVQKFAQRKGLSEEDAVEIVRQYRREKKAKQERSATS